MWLFLIACQSPPRVSRGPHSDPPTTTASPGPTGDSAVQDTGSTASDTAPDDSGSHTDSDTEGETATDPQPKCPDILPGSGEIAGPAGLMVQVLSTADLCELQRALEHVCEDHRHGGQGTIHDLLLTDVVTLDGTRPTEDLNLPVLEALAPYFGCFDNLFFGTIPETLLDDPYGSDTILSEDKRWEWLWAAQRVAPKVVDWMEVHGGGSPWHWYISYEANLNYMTDDAYRDAYVALLLQHTADLEASRPETVKAWSPTFWTDPSGLSAGDQAALGTDLADLFARVPGIDWVLIQDHVGVEPSWTCADVLTYYDLVRAAGSGLDAVQLNVEYFTTEGGYGPGDALQIADRIACYQAGGAAIGASFEMRYWYANHGH